MATLAVSNIFAPNTLAESSEINQNFDDVEAFVNTNMIQKDASVAFTAVPSGPAANPVSDNQFTRKAYVDVPFAYSTFSGTPASVGAATLLPGWGSVVARGVTATTNGFTILTTRTYEIGAAAVFGTNAGGTRRDFTLTLNGTNILGMQGHSEDLGSSGYGCDVSPGTRPIALTAGDLIAVSYIQNAGVAITFNGIIWIRGVPGL